MKNLDFYVGNSKFLLANSLKKNLSGKSLVFLCVGTDKVTGDALGPLCGQLLTKKYNIPAFVYGNFDFPIHAKNVADVCKFIKKYHSASKIVAIDSALGKENDIGLIRFGKGSIKTGSAIRNNYVEAGDYFLTATVASGGIDDNSKLFSTRLKIVDDIANCICQAISLSYGEEEYFCKTI